MGLGRGASGSAILFHWGAALFSRRSTAVMGRILVIATMSSSICKSCVISVLSVGRGLVPRPTDVDRKEPHSLRIRRSFLAYQRIPTAASGPSRSLPAVRWQLKRLRGARRLAENRLLSRPNAVARRRAGRSGRRWRVQARLAVRWLEPRSAPRLWRSKDIRSPCRGVSG